MSDQGYSQVEKLYRENATQFGHWEKVKDVIDQLIDLMLNYRQSGHPGGSRSKVHAMVTTLLSGAMKWDIRHPDKRFSDRFILSAGHTAPLVYATLCVMCDAMRTRYRNTGDSRYFIPENRAVLWEDLLVFRRRGGLPGHAEMSGKTLFLKANTGPSGHGIPIAAGQALALKRAGIEQVKVFAFEGEGGLTPGASHETKNSAWALGLSNLVFYLDWNDFGIDNQSISSVVHGTPELWFESYGWRVFGTQNGEDWGELTRAILEAAHGQNLDGVPSLAWSRNRKGRGYYKYDNVSHGSPHKTNSDLFWKCRKDFADKYGVTWEGFGNPPGSDDELKAQLIANLNVALDIIRDDEDCLNYLSDRLVELGESVPRSLVSLRFDTTRNPFRDPELYDFKKYPAEIWAKPGEFQPNRAALASWGAYVNTWARKKYGRPLFLASSADLADSTNISGFAKAFGDIPGWGVYNRKDNPEGVLLPQEITEFANAGISCGAATVNLSPNPFEEWNGFMTACSTYGSFVYLKYGLMRLYSQTAQDSDLKTGKVLWVAGHSGPETADDSRTHFGIFAPGVTQLFPDGQVLDLHPWEYNEVPVVIAAGLATAVPILALHLTRPPVEIPDREAAGIPSHFEAARGAYIMREYRQDLPKMGCLFVQGTSSTANIIKILPDLEREKLNVKIVAAISPQLFALQPESYRNQIVTPADRMDSTLISNRSRRVGFDWIFNPLAPEYAMTSDWDNQWRTGGTLDEVIEEAHLSPDWLLKGIERFVRERADRLARIRDMLNATEQA
ncbi:transketolase [bacterium]|nr:transketolase [candidate division CSSED10-310 bacterium]